MTKRRLLVVGGLVAAGAACFLLLRPAGRDAPAGASREAAPDGPVPSGWPSRLGERVFHEFEFGFVYAGDGASVDPLRDVLATVAEDVRQEGVAMPGAGLILAVDAKEPYPCEIPRFIEQMKKADPNRTDEESAKGLKAILDAQKQTEELGLDMSVVLSLALIPIEPKVVGELIDGLPVDLDRRVQWCVICPTDGCLQTAFKALFDVGLKKAKPSMAQRAAIAVMRPAMERKGVEIMKKGRQLGFYSLLLGVDKNLSAEQKRRMIASYREKLGLNEKPDPNDPSNAPPDPHAKPADSNAPSVSIDTQRPDRSAA
ncbi:MAG: hypothetical protein GX448_13680 [Planctomycetes bacterium]|nr:hypothetical protein [Planctomycetota bacterium]